MNTLLVLYTTIPLSLMHAHTHTHTNTIHLHLILWQLCLLPYLCHVFSCTSVSYNNNYNGSVDLFILSTEKNLPGPHVLMSMPLSKQSTYQFTALFADLVFAGQQVVVVSDSYVGIVLWCECLTFVHGS